jgi:hypothetical protein
MLIGGNNFQTSEMNKRPEIDFWPQFGKFRGLVMDESSSYIVAARVLNLQIEVVHHTISQCGFCGDSECWPESVISQRVSSYELEKISKQCVPKRENDQFSSASSMNWIKAMAVFKIRGQSESSANVMATVVLGWNRCGTPGACGK